MDCLENPLHCGGSGGCNGAVAQLAFNYTAQHGVALEADYPYTATAGTCKSGYKAAVTCEG